MILLDTDVLIYAFNPDPSFCQWARGTIASAVAGDGAAIKMSFLFPIRHQERLKSVESENFNPTGWH
jgi:hypothetical protein